MINNFQVFACRTADLEVVLINDYDCSILID